MNVKLKIYLVSITFGFGLVGFTQAADSIQILKAAQAGPMMLAINGSGGHVVDAVNTFNKIELYAKNKATGQVNYITASLTADKKGYFGTLSAAKGDWSVYAKLYTKNAAGTIMVTQTPTSIDVTVK
jgi:hypothetical protein